jgi:hypothetical protein
LSPAAKNEALAAATAQGLGMQNNADSGDCEPQHLTAQALKVIDGESKARAFLARLRAHQADAHDLGVVVSMLYGPALRGFCSVLVKSLEVPHG